MAIIRSIKEITLDQTIQSKLFDISVGYICSETRSIHVLKRSHHRCMSRIMFFSSEEDPSAKDIYPTWSKKANLIPLNMKDGELLDDAWEEGFCELLKLPGHRTKPLSILLDISSMPRCVMAGVMATLDDFTTNNSEINIVVAYCLAKYSPPSDRYFANKKVKPIHHHFTGFSLDPGLPVAAVVGLGYEKGKALGAVEYIQSANSWIFIPVSEEKKYYKKVEQHNQTILKSVSERQKFVYSVHSPIHVLSKLESLVSILVSTHKAVLLPFGPKIFFFCSLLTSLVHKRCAVWDVSGESTKSKADVSPSAFVMCLEFSMKGSDDSEDGERSSQENDQQPQWMSRVD